MMFNGHILVMSLQLYMDVSLFFFEWIELVFSPYEEEEATQTELSDLRCVMIEHYGFNGIYFWLLAYPL